MNLVIWSSPAKKTHIFFGVILGALVASSMSSTAGVGSILVCTVTGLEQRVHFSLRLSPQTEDAGRVQAADHERALEMHPAFVQVAPSCRSSLVPSCDSEVLISDKDDPDCPEMPCEEMAQGPRSPAPIQEG